MGGRGPGFGTRGCDPVYGLNNKTILSLHFCPRAKKRSLYDGSQFPSNRGGVVRHRGAVALLRRNGTSHVSRAASGAFVRNSPQQSVHINCGQSCILLKLEQALRHCSSNKAPGVDNIPYEAFWVDLPWSRHAILQFLDLCRSLCCIPSVWKHGTVVPLPKAAASAVRGGYCPITLTCCFALF